MNIFQKISAVMQDVRYLAKDDTIAYKTTKYKAISEEKVTSTVRESLIKHGIDIIPIEMEHKRAGDLTSVDVKYRIQNIEDPEDYIIAVSSGTGADTQDKGVGKAMTYAYKYLLLRTFAIPTGEDPDKVSSDELDDKKTIGKEEQTVIVSLLTEKYRDKDQAQEALKELTGYSRTKDIKLSEYQSILTRLKALGRIQSEA